MKGRRERSRGFSLFELLFVMVVIGILAGIVVPTLRKAIDKAEAAKIMTDVRNVSLGVRTYIEDTGGLPASSTWGESPPDLVPYLSEAVPFTYKTTTSRLFTQQAQGTVRLEIRYPNQDPIGVALQRFTGADITWTNTRLTVWIER